MVQFLSVICSKRVEGLTRLGLCLFSIAALEEEDDDDYDGEECEGRKKLEVKAHQASHTNYLMMRGYCCPGIGTQRSILTIDYQTN